MSSERRHFADGDSWLWLQPDFLAGTADAWLARLDRSVDWRQDRIRLYGREHPIPRRQAWYGAGDYRYSGLLLPARPLPDALQALQRQVAAACAQDFNAVLLNRYANGQDRMGWHSDDEAELGRNPAIAIVSLGACRPLALRARADHRRRFLLDLAHGSLLLMGGAFQHHWQHALPARRGIDALRISLTFRCMAPLS